MSCVYCSGIVSYKAHVPLDCKYRQSIYCAVCSIYGHSSADCPNKIAWALRQGLPTDGLVNLVFTVKDCDKEIKAKLISHGLKAGSLNKMRLRQLLVDFVNTMNPPRLLQFTK
jgi:hypothetical protein